MRIKTLLGLILCNLVWSLHPVMGKWLLEEFSPIQVAWLRYVSALGAYWIFVGVKTQSSFRGISFASMSSFFSIPRSWNQRSHIFILGFMAFCFAPLIQNLGLAKSLASENALIVAMEPVITVFMAWLILRERMVRADFIAFGFAILGFILLTRPVSWLGSQEKRSRTF